MKIYTKTGDKGESSLLFGTRVSKGDRRLEAYGTLDELNSHVGLLRTMKGDQSQESLLHAVQEALFTLGSLLAAEKNREQLDQINQSDITSLEGAIDTMEKELPELKNFILPGGTQASAQAHVCRTVCRRAERISVSLHQDDPFPILALNYLNRLSDYFFVLARFLNYKEGKQDTIWKK